MISVIIPVFRESEYLEILLGQLLEDTFRRKEIIVVVDEPTEKTDETKKAFGSAVKFITNAQRRGKSNALNGAAETASGDILLFLDSDVLISSMQGSFIRRVAKEMEEADLLEIRKNVILNRWLFSRLFSYESLSNYITGWMMSKTGFCSGLCGQAFAVKREFFDEIGGFKNVVSEDIEMGIQTYIMKRKYAYSNDLEIKTKTPSSWKELIRQRTRWGLGAGYHMRVHWRHYISNLAAHPKQTVLGMYWMWPSLMSIASLFMIDSIMGKALMLSLITLSMKFTVMLPFVFTIGSAIVFLKNAMIFATINAISFAGFLIASRRFGFRFRALEFTLYYAFFSPALFSIYVVNFVRAFLTPNAIVPSDWKV